MKLLIEKNPEKRLSLEQRKIKVGKGFIYHESSQPFYKTKILMKNLEAEPELYVNKIEKKVYQIPELIIFLKVFEETKKGIARVHSGAVADQRKQGILLGAWQDIGKTTLVLLLDRKGYYILGDDEVKISQDGQIQRFHSRAGIFPHKSNLGPLPLSLQEKLLGWFKYHFIRFPFQHRFVYPNLRVNYKKMGKTLEAAELKKIYILERGKPEIFKISYESAVRKIMLTSLEEFFPGGFPRRFFHSYCFTNDIPPALAEERYKQILTSAFRNKECFVISGQGPFDFYKLFLEYENK